MEKRKILASIISGFLLSIGMINNSFWIVSWFALIPFIWAICSNNDELPLIKKCGKSALYGLITGLFYHLIILYWMIIFGFLPWVGLCIFQSIYIMFFAVMVSLIINKKTHKLLIILIPSAWTVMQFLRTLGPYGFPWGGLAHISTGFPALIQIASITGSWGIEFIVCFINVGIFLRIVHLQDFNPKRFDFDIAIFFCVLLLAANLFCNEQIAGDKTSKIAIIQGNLDQDVIPDFEYLANTIDTYTQMSLDSSKTNPDFILWPETALPIVISPYMENSIAKIASTTNSNLLIGAYSSPNSDEIRLRNSVYLFNKEGIKTGLYSKVHLVPFGEFVPLRKYLPFIKGYGPREDDVVPGIGHNLLRTDKGKIGVIICFESLFPQISRLEVKNGAQALFIFTNDAWFKKTTAAKQHFDLARLRAVENRRFIVRTAATGISGIIYPFGETFENIGIFKKGIVSGRIEMRKDLTFYSRYGDYFAYLCIAVVLYGIVRRKL